MKIIIATVPNAVVMKLGVAAQRAPWFVYTISEETVEVCGPSMKTSNTIDTSDCYIFGIVNCLSGIAIVNHEESRSFQVSKLELRF